MGSAIELPRGGGSLTYPADRVWDLLPEAASAYVNRTRSDLEGVLGFKNRQSLAAAVSLLVYDHCGRNGSFPWRLALSSPKGSRRRTLVPSSAASSGSSKPGCTQGPTGTPQCLCQSRATDQRRMEDMFSILRPTEGERPRGLAE